MIIILVLSAQNIFVTAYKRLSLRNRSVSVLSQTHDQRYGKLDHIIWRSKEQQKIR